MGFGAREGPAQIALKKCNPNLDSLSTLKNIQNRFEAYLTSLDNCDKADLADANAEQLNKQKHLYELYAEFSSQHINSASQHCDGAAGRASGLRAYPDEQEWIAKWSNERPQAELKAELAQLYSVDISTLRIADAGLANLWEATEVRLKKHLSNPENVAPKINADTPKKSLRSF